MDLWPVALMLPEADKTVSVHEASTRGSIYEDGSADFHRLAGTGVMVLGIAGPGQLTAPARRP
ncbi:hypothetical protein ACFV2N_47005, partial [Streptomyces sp. NPDC059680]|uniref:hypothetical protein n=1 Tax=Streptomyces sp. NPDC059680 TaxID=3346904 RepID=UPI003677E67A